MVMPTTATNIPPVAASAARPRPAAAPRRASHAPTANAAASQIAMKTLASRGLCAIRLGAISVRCHDGDHHCSKPEVPSRPAASSNPRWAITIVAASATPTRTSSRCPARWNAVRACDMATAIGSRSRASAAMIGRPGPAEPPHQIRKAPTVPNSAPATTAISTICRRNAPPRCHIANAPVAASTAAGVKASRPYSWSNSRPGPPDRRNRGFVWLSVPYGADGENVPQMA